MTNNPKGLNQYTGKSKAGGSFAVKKTPLSRMSEIGDSIRAKQAKANSVNTARLQANAARADVGFTDGMAKSDYQEKEIRKILPKSSERYYGRQGTEQEFDEIYKKEIVGKDKAIANYITDVQKFRDEYKRGTSNKTFGQRADNADETLRFANRSQSSRKK